MFEVDYNNVGVEPVKPGEYEVIPTKYDIDQAKTTGNTRIIFNYEIRSDVDQPCQGQEIKFDNFTVTENSMWRFNQASKAAGIPNGTKFNSVKEWAETFKNKPIRVVVGEREYNGNKYPEVKSFKESQEKDLTNDPFGGSVDLSDDDLPF